jgi:hypothetical protein
LIATQGLGLASSTQLRNLIGVHGPADLARLSGTPRLVVVVDTEEEFDWRQPFSRSATKVSHIREQHRAHRILQRYGIRPLYAVDFPVASQEQAYRPLREWLEDNQCQVGAHLHPWVNPPDEEELSVRNSFPGNLPQQLECEKLRRLTDTIATNFGCRPTVYRAGRYGIGPATGGVLEELGYRIDTSVVPFTNFGDMGGPDFSYATRDPFWFGPTGGILEVPLTVGRCGILRHHGDRIQSPLMSGVGLRFHLPGVFARLGLFERIRLTPEGATFGELRRLTDCLLASENRIFVLSYHSPSVVPGNTPYVRREGDLQGFLGVLDRYCEYFMARCGGRGSTLEEIYETLPKPSRGEAKTQPLAADEPNRPLSSCGGSQSAKRGLCGNAADD